jgi:hypothetical protein
MSRASDRGRDLNTAVARAGISDVVRILLLTNSRTSAVDRAHVLAQGVARDFEPAAGLAADLQSAHTLGRVRELDTALTLIRACDIPRPFDLDRLSTVDLALPRDHIGSALERRISRARAVLDDPDVDHAGLHSVDRTQARFLERSSSHHLDLVCALSRSSDLAWAQAVADSGDGMPQAIEKLDWSGALRLLVDRRIVEWDAIDQTELCRSLRQVVRLGALARAIETSALLQAPLNLPMERPGETRMLAAAWLDRLEAQRDAVLDVYIQLGILEDRIDGHLPAWEGIRIVRERGLAE